MIFSEREGETERENVEIANAYNTTYISRFNDTNNDITRRNKRR